MTYHDLQIIMEGKSVIIRLDDAEIQLLRDQLEAPSEFITVVDTNGEIHAFNSEKITAVTAPKNHDLCESSTKHFIELYRLSAITEEELRGHFGLGKKPVGNTIVGAFGGTMILGGGVSGNNPVASTP